VRFMEISALTLFKPEIATLSLAFQR